VLQGLHWPWQETSRILLTKSHSSFKTCRVQRGELLFLSFECIIKRRGEEDTKILYFNISPKVEQQNHLSPEYISVSRAKTRNGRWWQIYSSRFLTSVSCPEQGQLRAVLCPTRSWEREGIERKPGTVSGMRSVLLCRELSHHGNTRFHKSGYPEKGKNTHNSPGKSCRWSMPGKR